MDIPDKDHVIRHIPYNRLLKDADGNIIDKNGMPYGILPQAFELREKDNKKLLVRILNQEKPFESGKNGRLL